MKLACSAARDRGVVASGASLGRGEARDTVANTGNPVTCKRPAAGSLRSTCGQFSLLAWER